MTLVDERRYDVPTSCTSSGKEDHSYAYAIQDSTQYASHRVLSRTENLHESAVVISHHLSSYLEERRKSKDGVRRFGYEFPAKRLDGNEEQNAVGDEDGSRHREFRQVVDDGEHTRQTSCCDVIGQQERGPTQSINGYAEVDGEEVLQEFPDATFLQLNVH